MCFGFKILIGVNLIDLGWFYKAVKQGLAFASVSDSVRTKFFMAMERGQIACSVSKFTEKTSQ